jgi:hypothetical protein
VTLLEIEAPLALGEIFTLNDDPQKVRWMVAEKAPNGYRVVPVDVSFKSHTELAEWFAGLSKIA